MRRKQSNKFLWVLISLLSTLFIFGNIDIQAKISENPIVSKDKVWEITFNDQIKFDNNAISAIQVKNKKGEKVNVRLQLSEDKNIIFVKPPVRNYEEGETYTLTINKNIQGKGKGRLKKKEEFTFKIKSEELFQGMTILNLEETVDSEEGKTYVFDQMNKIGKQDEKGFNTYGWKTNIYKINNFSKIRPMLYTTQESKELPIPVKLKGWLGVYVGYSSHTEEFKVAYKDSEVYFKNEIDGNANKTSKYINEKFMFAQNFQEESISILPVEGKKSEIAYVKFVPLSEKQIALYNLKAKDKKGVIYDNDGYTDFFWGKYPDVNSLQQMPVNLVSKLKADEINWTLGTTGLLNYNSAYAGPAFYEAEKYDPFVREGDILARSQISNIINSSGKSPLVLIGNTSKYVNLKVNASLRMNTFYNEDHTKFLNGYMYEYYEDCLQEDSYFLSYYYPKYREYILGVLKEASAMEGVSGMTMDFARYPYVMGKEASLEEKIQIMNDFLRQVRKEIPSKKLTVRFPYMDPLSYGLDVETWVKEGLVDRIIPSALSYEDFYDFSEYSNLVKGTDVELYLGIAANIKGIDLTPETEKLLKEGKYVPDNKYLSTDEYLFRAKEAYEGGAKGIFLFNTLNNLDITEELSPKFALLNDKTEVDKWYAFKYPAYLINYKIN